MIRRGKGYVERLKVMGQGLCLGLEGLESRR